MNSSTKCLKESAWRTCGFGTAGWEETQASLIDGVCAAAAAAQNRQAALATEPSMNANRILNGSRGIFTLLKQAGKTHRCKLDHFVTGRHGIGTALLRLRHGSEALKTPLFIGLSRCHGSRPPRGCGGCASVEG
ncbi:hypothetical protein SBV1_2790015 [Verrucomicrobia bacterium]|nr:hypothetical protein SBV1_2790015 [Verrucomicrobiota bacterium]